MNLPEIDQWVQRWFHESLNETEAEQWWGPTTDKTNMLAHGIPKDPRFRSLVYERAHVPGLFLSGVQLSLTMPEFLAFGDIVAKYGDPRLLGVAWDDWSAPTTYGFRILGHAYSGMLILGMYDKDTEQPRVADLVLRRFPKKSA